MDPAASPQGAGVHHRSPLRHESSNSVVSFVNSVPEVDQDSLASPTESTHLDSHNAPPRPYGTMPSRLVRTTTPGRRRPFSQLPFIASLRQRSIDSMGTIGAGRFRAPSLSRMSSRPKSAYDEPREEGGEIPDADAKVNGIRVWYSSFTSIDWLHDAIQDSLRFSKLRKGRSLRSRIRLVFDKSLGWIIVTIVGFLTAVVAFLVVRGEQWLFDLKDGYCDKSWLKSKRFCCPQPDEGELSHSRTKWVEESCAAWISWSEVVLHDHTDDEGTGAVGYISYTLIAVYMTRFCVLRLTYYPCSLADSCVYLVSSNLTPHKIYDIRHAKGANHE